MSSEGSGEEYVLNAVTGIPNESDLESSLVQPSTLLGEQVNNKTSTVTNKKCHNGNKKSMLSKRLLFLFLIIVTGIVLLLITLLLISIFKRSTKGGKGFGVTRPLLSTDILTKDLIADDFFLDLANSLELRALQAEHTDLLPFDPNSEPYCGYKRFNASFDSLYMLLFAWKKNFYKSSFKVYLFNRQSSQKQTSRFSVLTIDESQAESLIAAQKEEKTNTFDVLRVEFSPNHRWLVVCRKVHDPLYVYIIHRVEKKQSTIMDGSNPVTITTVSIAKDNLIESPMTLCGSAQIEFSNDSRYLLLDGNYLMDLQRPTLGYYNTGFLFGDLQIVNRFGASHLFQIIRKKMPKGPHKTPTIATATSGHGDGNGGSLFALKFTNIKQIFDLWEKTVMHSSTATTASSSSPSDAIFVKSNDKQTFGLAAGKSLKHVVVKVPNLLVPPALIRTKFQFLSGKHPRDTSAIFLYFSFITKSGVAGREEFLLHLIYRIEETKTNQSGTGWKIEPGALSLCGLALSKFVDREGFICQHVSFSTDHQTGNPLLYVAHQTQIEVIPFILNPSNTQNRELQTRLQSILSVFSKYDHSSHPAVDQLYEQLKKNTQSAVGLTDLKNAKDFGLSNNVFYSLLSGGWSPQDHVQYFCRDQQKLLLKTITVSVLWERAKKAESIEQGRQ